MRRPWTRDGVANLERRLRDERPRPSEELVRRVAEESAARPTRPRLRLGLAGALSGVALAVVIALGGLGSPIDTAARIAQFDNAGGNSHGKNNHAHGHGKPAHHQYDEKITICHRPPGNPSNGQTLTLPRSGAEAHLRQHRLDSRGPCPPPPKPKPKPKPKQGRR
jgi:hypothetical protein